MVSGSRREAAGIDGGWRLGTMGERRKRDLLPVSGQRTDGRDGPRDHRIDLMSLRPAASSQSGRVLRQARCVRLRRVTGRLAVRRQHADSGDDIDSDHARSQLECRIDEPVTEESPTVSTIAASGAEHRQAGEAARES